METIIKILQFVFSFSLLVLIHEFGHYFFARLFGIRVEKFYLFFNPGFSLLKFKVGQTEYGIGWIPFGGYVKIAGMIDESMDTEQMAQPAKPDEFRSKPAWQRLFVMLGGIIMNLVLALFIYIGMTWSYGDRYIANEDIAYGWVFNDIAKEIGFQNGDKILTIGGNKITNSSSVFAEIVLNNAPDVEVLRDGKKELIVIPDRYIEKLLNTTDFMYERTPFVVGLVMENSPAQQAGIQVNDSLAAVNGVPLAFFDQYTEYFTQNKGQLLDVTLFRDSAGVKVERTIPVRISEDGMLGVQRYGISAFVPIQTRSYTFLESIPKGFQRTAQKISEYWKQLKMIFQPKTKAYKSLGGPIAIFQIFPNFWSWEVFWALTAFLSLVLAVMNLLPIPGLDGGHVVFVLYEMITRRKPSDKFMEYAQMTGILIIFALIIFATGNDIFRLFTK